MVSTWLAGIYASSRKLKRLAEIEDEISELEKVEKLSGDQVKLLKELRAELASINKKKEEYVSAHPEQRGLVYKRRRDKEKEEKDGDARPTQVKKERNLFNKDGLPRHPERSIYYDPLMNPYGMPPPGMPYVQRGKIDLSLRSVFWDPNYSLQRCSLGKLIAKQSQKKIVETVSSQTPTLILNQEF